MTAALLGAAQWLEGATRKEVAISGNHVSRKQQHSSQNCIAQQRNCSNSNSNSRLGIGQYE